MSKVSNSRNFPRQRSSSSLGSAKSESSDDSNPLRSNRSSRKGDLPPPVLVYHESARSIVFRDHLRRAAEGELVQKQQQQLKLQQDDEEPNNSQESSAELAEMANLFYPEHMTEKIEIQGFQPSIVPLPHLELGPNDEFLPLLESDTTTQDQWTQAEKEVVHYLETQCAVVKTVKNSDWTPFLHRFKTPQPSKLRHPDDHKDIEPREGGFPFNSFVTSTSLLPAGGRKMRCFGANSVYTTGVVFALPEFSDPAVEAAAVSGTRTWCWPSGYSAKTEFNIDYKGNLINGRQEALVPLSTIRQYNDDYLNKEDHMIAGRLIKGGLKTVPYNEIFIRVGGRGRIVNKKDCATGEDLEDENGTGRSFDKGVGLPIALFVRTATFGHLISLIRTRARLLHILGEKHIQGIPLLMLTPDKGVRVLTERLQQELLKIASRNLNPFQNPLIAHKTTINDTDEKHLETKLEELIDLDESICGTLTPEEMLRLAGGFGATDDSIAKILKDAMIQDKECQKNGVESVESHRLQDIVNEGLSSAVRSGDYYTSRQLLILYSLIASEGHKMDLEDQIHKLTEEKAENKQHIRKASLDSEAMLLKRQSGSTLTINSENSRLPPPPPPPPLDTDRLRSATNSDGLLAVLGAAQVLKAMKDGSAKKRTEESFLSVEE